MNRYRLVQIVDNQMIATEFSDESIIVAMDVRGYDLNGINTNPNHRDELINQPKFTGLCGPMFDGDAIRYETWEVYNMLSQ